jgi:hypothetical protein
MEVAREELGLSADAPLRLRRIPAKKTSFELFFGEKTDHRNTTTALAGVIRDLQPLVALARRVVAKQQAELELPPEFVVRP